MGLIQDALQCAGLTSGTNVLSFSQSIYNPSQTTLSFSATCLGTSVFPNVVGGGYSGDFDVTSRFREEDCDFVVFGDCCEVDPSPGEISCDGSRKSICRGFVGPDEPVQVSCSSGVLALTVTTDDFVLPDEGHYIFPDSRTATVTTQPDMTFRIDPANAGTTVHIAPFDNLFSTLGICDCSQTSLLMSNCAKNVDADVCDAVSDAVQPTPEPAVTQAPALLIEDASQCTETSFSSGPDVSFSHPIYNPSQTTLSFSATCLGASAFPNVVGGGYSGDFDVTSRFREEDCGFVGFGDCCEVDPSPGEISCDGSRKSICRDFVGPDEPVQVSCSSGVLALTVTSDDFVLPDEGHYIFPDSRTATVTTQPDMTFRFDPANAGTTVHIGPPTNLINIASSCGCQQGGEVLTDCIQVLATDICPAPAVPDTAPPTPKPTVAPTKAPTQPPTKAPTTAPTKFPTLAPVEYPTKLPTVRPSPNSTVSPSTPIPVATVPPSTMFLASTAPSSSPTSVGTVQTVTDLSATPETLVPTISSVTIGTESSMTSAPTAELRGETSPPTVPPIAVNSGADENDNNTLHEVEQSGSASLSGAGSEGQSDESNSTAIIIGVVIAVAVLGVACVIGCVFCSKYYFKSQQQGPGNKSSTLPTDPENGLTMATAEATPTDPPDAASETAVLDPKQELASRSKALRPPKPELAHREPAAIPTIAAADIEPIDDNVEDTGTGAFAEKRHIANRSIARRHGSSTKGGAAEVPMAEAVPFNEEEAVPFSEDTPVRTDGYMGAKDQLFTDGDDMSC